MSRETRLPAPAAPAPDLPLVQPQVPVAVEQVLDLGHHHVGGPALADLGGVVPVCVGHGRGGRLRCQSRVPLRAEPV